MSLRDQVKDNQRLNDHHHARRHTRPAVVKRTHAAVHFRLQGGAGTGMYKQEREYEIIPRTHQMKKDAIIATVTEG